MQSFWILLNAVWSGVLCILGAPSILDSNANEGRKTKLQGLFEHFRERSGWNDISDAYGADSEKKDSLNILNPGSAIIFCPST